jgi:hypothetical protein
MAPVLLAPDDAFAMIPGGGPGPFHKATDADWFTPEPLDLLEDVQRSMPHKQRLPKFGGPKPKPAAPVEETPPPMII